MTRLADLHASVQATVTSNRLGTPVFVRYLLQTQDKPGSVPVRLAQAVSTIRSWFGQPLERLYAQGQVKGRLIALTLEFRGGGTAMVGWSSGPGRGDGLDLLVLGNRGSLTHDLGSAQLWDEVALPADDKPDAALVEWIERALRSGQPEPAGK